MESTSKRERVATPSEDEVHDVCRKKTKHSEEE